MMPSFQMQTNIFRQRSLQAIRKGAVGRIIYTYNDRQIGVAWVYSTKAASAPVSAEDGTDNETAGSENTTDAAKTGTSSTADKEKKPLKLTKQLILLQELV